jgi:hypothetical protein
VRGPVPDQGAVVVRAAGNHDRPDPGLERGRPGGVVPAQAHPHHPDPVAVQVAAGAKHVERGGHRGLKIRADFGRIPGFSLAGAIKRERGHPPGQEDVLRREELFLRGVQACDQHDQWRPVSARRAAQVSHHGGAVEGQFHPLSGGIEPSVRVHHGGHRLIGRPAVFRLVKHPHELAEVIAEGRADPGLSRRQGPARFLRLAGEPSVQVAVGAPGVQPVRPAFERPRHPGEVTGVDPLGREPRTPVGHGRGDLDVRHVPSPSITPGRGIQAGQQASCQQPFAATLTKR